MSTAVREMHPFEAAVKAGRHSDRASRSNVARPRLDGGAHGVILAARSGPHPTLAMSRDLMVATRIGPVHDLDSFGRIPLGSKVL